MVQSCNESVFTCNLIIIIIIVMRVGVCECVLDEPQLICGISFIDVVFDSNVLL